MAPLVVPVSELNPPKASAQIKNATSARTSRTARTVPIPVSRRTSSGGLTLYCATPVYLPYVGCRGVARIRRASRAEQAAPRRGQLTAAREPVRGPLRLWQSVAAATREHVLDRRVEIDAVPDRDVKRPHALPGTHSHPDELVVVKDRACCASFVRNR